MTLQVDDKEVGEQQLHVWYVLIHCPWTSAPESPEL